ncbi:MAG: DciA family protein [Alphaproteobacteria bacterium]|nr:DciA family protein [Alphaproteobacteria bacterium]
MKILNNNPKPFYNKISSFQQVLQAWLLKNPKINQEFLNENAKQHLTMILGEKTMYYIKQVAFHHKKLHINTEFSVIKNEIYNNKASIIETYNQLDIKDLEKITDICFSKG